MPRPYDDQICEADQFDFTNDDLEPIDEIDDNEDDDLGIDDDLDEDDEDLDDTDDLDVLAHKMADRRVLHARCRNLVTLVTCGGANAAIGR